MTSRKQEFFDMFSAGLGVPVAWAASGWDMLDDDEPGDIQPRSNTLKAVLLALTFLAAGGLLRWLM